MFSTWIIVSAWVVTDFKHVPKCSICIKSISSPKSSFIIVAPVNKARSSKVSLLLTPYIGASIILIFILPFILFIASADTTCCSASPIIRSGLLFFITYSNIDWIFLIFSMLFSTINTRGFSNSAECVSWLVIKCGLFQPASYCIPSTFSTIVSGKSCVSIITTPVSSTCLKASPISSPKTLSLLDEIVATWSIFLPLILSLFFSKCFITLSTAEFIPSFKDLLFTLPLSLYASSNIANANTVAVVVPSPASLTVFLAASFNNLAPIFSTGSNNNIESATVTPSLVIVGFPLLSSNITHFPLAPNVELTACVSFLIPSNTLSLASIPKFKCLTIVSFVI